MMRIAINSFCGGIRTVTKLAETQPVNLEMGLLEFSQCAMFHNNEFMNRSSKSRSKRPDLMLVRQWCKAIKDGSFREDVKYETSSMYNSQKIGGQLRVETQDESFPRMRDKPKVEESRQPIPFLENPKQLTACYYQRSQPNDVCLNFAHKKRGKCDLLILHISHPLPPLCAMTHHCISIDLNQLKIKARRVDRSQSERARNTGVFRRPIKTQCSISVSIVQ